MTLLDPLLVSWEVAAASRSRRTEAEIRTNRAERREAELSRQRSVGRAEGIPESILKDGETSLRMAHCSADVVAAIGALFSAYRL
jgi:hypothetical protein